MENSAIEYDDLPLAAYLSISGFKIKAIKQNPQNPRLSVFIFDETKKLGEAVSLFYTHRSQVEPRRYLNAIRELKQKGVFNV